jgi:hypothetical protein
MSPGGLSQIKPCKYQMHNILMSVWVQMCSVTDQPVLTHSTLVSSFCNIIQKIIYIRGMGKYDYKFFSLSTSFIWFETNKNHVVNCMYCLCMHRKIKYLFLYISWLKSVLHTD